MKNTQIDVGRFEKREADIHLFLAEHGVRHLWDEAKKKIEQLPADEIQHTFQEQLSAALDFCLKKPEIKALDFSWYFDGRPIDVAYAYGLSSIQSANVLANTDLGPQEFQQLETDADFGYAVDEEFAYLDLSTSINTYVDWSDNLRKAVSGMDYEDDILQSIEDLFVIFNYRQAYLAGMQLLEKTKPEGLALNRPFWVSITRHGRWAVPVMVISG